MKHIKYAEGILAETLEEKDPGLIPHSKTLAERELDEKCREHISNISIT